MSYSDPDYQKKYKKRKRRETVKWINEFKASCKCFFCGESNLACIDFHHIDPSIKKGGISDMVQNRYSIKTIKQEINKCLPLCSNCHRKLHYELDLLSCLNFHDSDGSE